MLSMLKIITTAQIIVVLIILSPIDTRRRRKSHYHYSGRRNASSSNMKTVCMDMENTLRARRKTCFLRPDTGPCRADILQWYYDVKQKKCYQFFWGGCQGNGNRFETEKDCLNHCFLNMTQLTPDTPHFCQLTFDFGSCFGHFNRWAWDKYSKTCKPRLYSGCGGNQNNFETREECMKTCLARPHIGIRLQRTTCFPLDMNAMEIEFPSTTNKS